MVEKIDGRAIAENIKKQIAQEIFEAKGPRPNLAIILVGEREDSKLYVSLKEKEGVKVGVDTNTYKLDSDVPEQELLDVIKFLNSDPLIDGVLIQLPLPDKFDTDRIIAALDPNKDVDGFHPEHPDYILSPVLASVLACLEEIKFDYPGKSACVLYNSEIFGESVKKALEKKGMNIVAKDKSADADLLISAIGEPQVIKGNQIKDKAVIIDIGITKVEGKVLGDVDFESVKDKASFITPVPGGIGPMTVAFLLKNTWEIYKRKNKHD